MEFGKLKLVQRDRSQVKDDVPKPGPGPIERPSSSTKGVITFGIFVVMANFFRFRRMGCNRTIGSGSFCWGYPYKGRRRKRIQHFEGGIVGSLKCNGRTICRKGRAIFRATAAVARHNGQLNQALAREARLQSELKNEVNIILEGQFLKRLNSDPSLFKILEAEHRHLDARRETRLGTIAILNQKRSINLTTKLKAWKYNVQLGWNNIRYLKMKSLV